jgi:protein O-GlcNAc transferase
MKINKKSKRPSGLQKKKKQSLRPPGKPYLQNILRKAFALHQAGHLQGAEALYRQILRAYPNHPEALHCLGLLAHEVGKDGIAAELMSHALAVRPDFAEARYNLGNVLEELNKKGEAAESYRQAIAQRPDYVEAHYNLGILLQAQGKPDESVKSFRRVIALKPDFAEAYNNLGIALQTLGKVDEAVVSYRRAIGLKTDYAAGYNNLGILLQSMGKLEEAVENFRQALSLKPDYAAALSNLGIALKDLGKLEEAEANFLQALDINPDYAEVHYNRGILQKKRGKLHEAAASFRRAITLKPDYVEALSNLGSLLKDQGRLKEAIDCYRQAISVRPDSAGVYSNLLFCLNYLPGQSVTGYLDEARRYGRQVAGKVSECYSNWNCSADPVRLTVGMVSGDFRNHPIGFFLENILAHIDSSTITLIAYPTNRGEDELTARIRSRFSRWNPLAGLDDPAAASLIYDDGVHILIDLSGHTNLNRLPVFAWKPAPVQATWLGYFASTGVAEIDYLIADHVSVPASHQEHFTEKVWYLPETRFCFSPPVLDQDLPVTPLPALHNGYITFGCFQNLTKINDGVLAAWDRIFQGLPQSRLRLQNGMLDSPETRAQVLQRLSRIGIAPERVILEKAVPRTEYLAAHAHIDIILDTFPATGGTTTCEALWMGVPTVTLAGDTMLAREGASQLTSGGLSDWVATDREEYVAKATAYATNLEKLATLRAGLRQQVIASPLFDGPRFARNLEVAMWEMWRLFQAEH